MTKLLEKALAEAAKLPESEQAELATWILEELASEQRWQVALTQSADVVAELADEALAEPLSVSRGEQETPSRVPPEKGRQTPITSGDPREEG